MHPSLRSALEDFVGIIGLAVLLIGMTCLLIGLYGRTSALVALGVILWCSGFLIGDSSIFIHCFL